mmetsp:Transcript_36076/g.82855  ORF Transcript_36076/g.82855 Transcript_36076/m.82855 type:complete len:121 (-) Transcript_36076:53-415(-)
MLCRSTICYGSHRRPMGWTNALRAKRVNIWDVNLFRPDKLLCRQPFMETFFTRPKWLTRYGNPRETRTPKEEMQKSYDGKKYCDMGRIHVQDRRVKFEGDKLHPIRELLLSDRYKRKDGN